MRAVADASAAMYHTSMMALGAYNEFVLDVKNES